MSTKTRISWCDATWNPTTGCTKVSPGCKNCYAERVAKRLQAMGQPHYVNGFKLTLHGDALLLPLGWRKPRRVFVTSMSDAFHEELSDEIRDLIFAVVALCPQHRFQSLTKRSENQRRYFSDPDTPFRIRRTMDVILVDFEMKGMAEQWRPVAGWSKYEVSNYGSLRRGGKMLAQMDVRGYRQVALCENGEPRSRLVHALVLEAFRGPPGEGEETRHQNGDRSDNRLANLSWGSRTDNMRDASRHGTAGAWMKAHATLTPDQVVDIRRRRAAGERLDDIAIITGGTRKQVSAVALGKIFKPAPIGWPLRNLWMGVSVENADCAERIDDLRATRAAHKFLSLEPLLSPLPDLHLEGIDWVIVGGESGPGHREMDVAWLEDIVAQCRAQGTPVFVKQDSASRPGQQGRLSDELFGTKELPDGLRSKEAPCTA